MGNIHTESLGNPIGLEIHAQAFAFSSAIPNLDNATFYEYKIINRSANALYNTYFGQWVDPDLGNYLDDYVGCDVDRGMGYCYNGDAFDDGAAGYGANPPAIGVDFLQGPLADEGDGLDNDRDSCTDCTWIDVLGQMVAVSDTILPERIKMSKFVYYNNTGNSVNGNPVTPLNHYNYMRGIWKNGNKMTYGGNGAGTGTGTTSDTCDFMFPGDSDPNHWGTAGVPEIPWDEVSSGNAPDDRRFLQSAGPFTLQPGAVTCIMTAAVWARAASGGVTASVALLNQADDEIQEYFNSCFTTFPVSVNEIAISSETIHVYPNPFRENTTVIFPPDVNHKPVDLILYNSDGKIVRTYKKIKTQQLIIRRNELNSGVYFYKIASNEMEIKSGKLVIVD